MSGTLGRPLFGKEPKAAFDALQMLREVRARLASSVSPAKAGAQIQPERLGMMRLLTWPSAMSSRGSIWAPAFAGENG